MYLIFFLNILAPTFYSQCLFVQGFNCPKFFDDQCVGEKLLPEVHSIELPKKEKDANLKCQGTHQAAGCSRHPGVYCSC